MIQKGSCSITVELNTLRIYCLRGILPFRESLQGFILHTVFFFFFSSNRSVISVVQKDIKQVTVLVLLVTVSLVPVVSVALQTMLPVTVKVPDWSQLRQCVHIVINVVIKKTAADSCPTVMKVVCS